MGRLFRIVLVMIGVVVAGGAGGCSAYHPLRDGVGFTEVPVGPDGYQVTYVGDSGVSPAEAHRYAMLRAAELTALRGMSYFRVETDQVFLGMGAHYWPGHEYTYVDSWPDRRGRARPFIRHEYEPGYVEPVTIPQVVMTVRLTQDPGGGAIPAGYLLRQAEAEKIELSPGVAERAGALPADAPASMPAVPAPTSMPAAP